MNRLTRILMAACLCCAFGCNTEIPTEDISDIHITKTSCEMKLTPSQAAEVGKRVNAQGSNYIFGSQNMLDLYNEVKNNVIINSEEKAYCVCGTDVCDKDIDCAVQDGASICAGYNKDIEEGQCAPILIEQRYLGYLIVTHLLPILKELMIVRDLSKTVLYRTSDDDTTKYVWSVIRSLIVNDNVRNHFFKSKEFKNRLDGFKYKCKVDDNNDCTRDEKGYIEFEINNDKKEELSATTIPTTMKPENYNIVGALAVLGAMAECQNGNSGNCPEERSMIDGHILEDEEVVNVPDELGNTIEQSRQIFPKDGLVFHVDGANTSATSGVPARIYSGYREIAVKLMKNAGEFDVLFAGEAKAFADLPIIQLANLEGAEGTPEDKIAKKIDQFLVDQTHYLLTAKTNLDLLLMDARIQRMIFLLFKEPKGINLAEKLNCAFIPDLNGNYGKKTSDCEGNDCFEPKEKGGYDMVCRPQITPEMISNEDGVVIMDALKNMFYHSYGDYFSDNEKLYIAHRRFFIHYLMSSLSSTDQRYLFEMTFTQNNRCVDHESPSGQIIGINQYCLNTLFQNNIFTIGNLASLVFGNGNNDVATDNICALADGIIMDGDFELKNSNNDDLFVLQTEQVQQVEKLLKLDSDVKSIAVSSIGIHLGDDLGSNPVTVNVKITKEGAENPEEKPYPLIGMWISHRCPMGASCTENNECGMCSNSNVPHDYGWFRGKETLESEYNENEGNANIQYNWTDYSDAICEKGVLVQKQTTP